MLIDLTIKITRKMAEGAKGNLNKALVGHLGTHFDVMDKEFPLEYTERDAVVFDVSHVENRDIEIEDIDLSLVGEHMFVAFYTGYMEREEYGGSAYFKEHPQLSHSLINQLLKRRISIIGVDCAGIRRGKEHTPADQRCADKDTFVIENLCNLKEVIKRGQGFIACTYPLSYEGITGLPCRVIAKIS